MPFFVRDVRVKRTQEARGKYNFVKVVSRRHFWLCYIKLRQSGMRRGSEMMAGNFLELRHIDKTYKTGNEQIHALRDINLTISAGEFVAILGVSGSGKSTFMNIVGGLDRPDSGDFLYRGDNIRIYDDAQMSLYRNKVIGFIFQNFNLDPSLTALENVVMPLIYANVPRLRRSEMAEDALIRVGLASRLHHRPAQLSGGQMQRVCIARAVVNRPEIILADEPTGNLDKKSGELVMELLRELARQGYTVLMVTHNGLQAQAADRIIEICDGRIVRDVKIK